MSKTYYSPFFPAVSEEGYRGTTVAPVPDVDFGAIEDKVNEVYDKLPPIEAATAKAVTDISYQSETLLQTITRADDYERIVGERTLVNGQPISTVYTAFQTQVKNDLESYSSSINLLGAKNQAGTGFVLNADTVLATGTGVTTTSLTDLISSNEDHEANISTFNQTLIQPDGVLAKAVLRLNVDGHIVGTTWTNDGKRGEVTFVADLFRIVSAQGGQYFTPFVVEGNLVKMTNVEVDTLKYSALVPLMGQEYNDLNPNGGYQIFPGGFMMQWGKLRQRVSAEQTFNLSFSTPFPNAVMCVNATPYINSYSRTADFWVQNVGPATTTGASFCTQGEDAGFIDGIDWIAFGY